MTEPTPHSQAKPNALPGAWCKADWITALLAALVSMVVYAWSAAPSVTLLDSGEFLVAAQHFGVPHPTGYPLWTLLTWLFLLLPIGNASHEVALFSGLCASLAVGLACAMLSSIQRWCFDEVLTGKRRFLPYVVAFAFALMLAFSQSMWSQAVIAEVYALHALLIGVFLVFCYSWVRKPSKDAYLLGAFFLLALAFTNHQLTMALAPLPYLLVLLLRRRAFFDWLFAGFLTVLLGYLGFAILSQDPLILKTAIRLFYCIALAFAVFLYLRKGRIRWRLVAFLPFVIALGLVPYAYMPLASSTNPPMNWGYTRTLDGFYFSFNRSQYSGSLSDMSLSSLGTLMGTKPQKPPQLPEQAKPGEPGSLELVQNWTSFFWLQLMKAFSIVAIVGYFASFFFVFRFPLPKRVWIYLLHIAFLLAAYLQPLTAHTKIDRGDWWTQMPYHTYTNLIFAILSGLGIGLLIYRLSQRRTVFMWLAPALLILPIFTFRGSEASCSQRDHWFGWMFGYDMLKDLPPGSIMIGGTDPGRFIPTYMIFGESPQPDKDKRKPFNRSDLYIITQNALGEPNYMKYLRDQYTAERPAPKNAFERWLGRETAYPKKPIAFPTEEETREIGRKVLEEGPKTEGPYEDDPGVSIFGAILKWLWEHNRDEHDFFVEESFSLEWTYDYAIPHGLIYQINKTKLDKIPDEAVKKDFEYWSAYKKRLLDDPNFLKDYDAQRSFSKLRQTTGNIYRYRKMDAEAERAYREALELWPGNGEVIADLAAYLGKRNDYDEVIKMWDRALEDDPNSFGLARMRAYAAARKEMQGQINSLQDELAQKPKSREALQKLVGLYLNLGETNNAEPLVERGMKDFPDDADFMRFVIGYYQNTDQPNKILIPAQELVAVEGTNPRNYYILARAWLARTNFSEFYKAANKAIDLGGLPMRDIFLQDPALEPFRKEPEFKKMVSPQFAAPAPAH